MSIVEQINRINDEKKRIAGKTTEFGLTDNDTVNIKTIADAITGIEVYGRIDVNVPENGSFEILPGYHKGGVVYAVNNPELDEEEYKLETGRIVTPLKDRDQTIEKGTGFYGLGAIVVKKIPHPYHDVSRVDADPNEVLGGVKYVDSNGVLKIGEMTDNRAVNVELTETVRKYDIDEGYHNGNGKVTIDPNLHDVSGTTATKDSVLETAYFVDANGNPTKGAIPTKSEDTDIIVSGHGVIVPSGYYANGTTKYLPTASVGTPSFIYNSDNDNVTVKVSQKTSGYVGAGDSNTDTKIHLAASGKTVTLRDASQNAIASKRVGDGAYSASVALTKGAGSVSATSTNVLLTKASSQPSSGYYITTTGSGSVSATGTATIGTAGWLEKDSKTATDSATSNTATAYYTVASAKVPTSIDPLTQTSVTVTAGYTSGVTISVSNDLLEALQAI